VLAILIVVGGLVYYAAQPCGVLSAANSQSAVAGAISTVQNVPVAEARELVPQLNDVFVPFENGAKDGGKVFMKFAIFFGQTAVEVENLFE